ncbi:gluconate:H+ symporter [Kordia sp.]|uniref:GntP family permease n=1 Tax=Kordia sp. TaxID=1965332 RepID=UPI0025C46CF3|nr:gluconate:H+ symporter [Kordia sp.]MCH2195768.1 GntP family permease [Kordia sp.]
MMELAKENIILDIPVLLSVLGGIAVLLVLILRFKIQAFIALLIASITVGILAGISPMAIITTIKMGMADTLGFVALVIGLGAIFGSVLEYSGGAEALARFMLKKFGEKQASWALMITGFLVAIPVFFDVAFIILVPIIYSLQRSTKKSLLLYAIPLLAGLAITHSFIPPTPGPIAVSDILGADLGWVILFGFIVGVPTAVVCGPIFAKYIAQKIHVDAPETTTETIKNHDYPAIGLILAIIGIPIFLIVCNTIINSPLVSNDLISEDVKEWIGLIGNPIVALIIANLIAWYVLGIRRKVTKKKLLDITSASMGPTGIIILLTGAGGVFKQMLVATETGKMLAVYFAEMGIPIIIFGFFIAVLVRILQGSATVAMITAAGITAPLVMAQVDITAIDKALLVIAIASGASIMSHVNDSGFWLVSKYLGITEKQTFQSWTVMTTILALTSFILVTILSIIL